MLGMTSTSMNWQEEIRTSCLPYSLDTQCGHCIECESRGGRCSILTFVSRR